MILANSALRASLAVKISKLPGNQITSRHTGDIGTEPDEFLLILGQPSDSQYYILQDVSK